MHKEQSEKPKSLRQRISQALSDGWTPEAIRHEIVTDRGCTAMEKRKILRELNMEE